MSPSLAFGSQNRSCATLGEGAFLGASVLPELITIALLRLPCRLENLLLLWAAALADVKRTIPFCSLVWISSLDHRAGIVVADAADGSIQLLCRRQHQQASRSCAASLP
ncbi:hypothetical protein [Zhengella mangrovi]|uniref:hypothetical protein n=1 Tax=Zhengella mangrovi TaxID=1982044 RepID=UPI0010563BD7|nr:hypothetical protein [Zhengella mangrovi]